MEMLTAFLWQKLSKVFLGSSLRQFPFETLLRGNSDTSAMLRLPRECTRLRLAAVKSQVTFHTTWKAGVGLARAAPRVCSHFLATSQLQHLSRVGFGLRHAFPRVTGTVFWEKSQDSSF